MLWTANTERYSEVIEGLNDTTDNLMAAIQRGEAGARWSAQGKGSRPVTAGAGRGRVCARCWAAYSRGAPSAGTPPPLLPGRPTFRPLTACRHAPRPLPAHAPAEVSPSTLYAAACVLEGVPFINGSPQNTFVPGLIDLAVQHNVLIGARRGCRGCWAVSRAAA